MSARPTSEVGDILLNASYRKEEADIEGGFAGVFGRIASAYFERYGDQGEALARIAAKNHRNGVDNPYAQIRKDLGFEFCNAVSERNPYVAAPLRRTDCSLISDGAAALVLADADLLPDLRRAIAFRARQHVNDILPLSRRDPIAFEGAARAWRAALDQAGLVLDDHSLVETHDCFTIAELIEYEAMGLTRAGKATGAARGLGAEGWASAGEPVRRPQGQGASCGRHGRVHACDGLHAAGGRGRGHADSRRGAGRRVQHGRRGRGQLRQHPGARQMSGPAAHMPEGGVAPVSRRVMNLAHFLVQAARRHPERHALICGEATLSWRELDGRSAALAGVGRPWRGQGRPRAGAFAQQL